MADQWYFARDGMRSGPYSAGQLKGMATTGELAPQDTVWKQGVTAGVQAGKVKNLFADAPHDLSEPTSSEALVNVAESPPPAPPEPPALLADSTPPEFLPVEVASPSGFLDIPDDVALIPLESTHWITVDYVPKRPPTPEKQEKPAEEKSPPASPGADSPPKKRDPSRHEPAAKNRRVLGVKGGDLVSQDGVTVRFRKRCLKCGHADTSLGSMPIRGGCTRVSFFCPKCKKNQQVEIQGVG